MRILKEAEVPFLVAGAYAFAHYTGIQRHTKDFDVFIHKDSVEKALNAFTDAGYVSELTFPHWLAKAFSGEYFVDMIFTSGNGVSPVDEGWFARASTVHIFGEPVLLCPTEEIIWQKSFIQERERYDGADVVHLIHARAERMDWEHLVSIFGRNWRVLFAHLILFGFIYPNERHRIPEHVMLGLMERLQRKLGKSKYSDKVCQGTLLSRAQYLVDVEEWGYTDGRLFPETYMTEEEVAHWTAAIEPKDRPQ